MAYLKIGTFLYVLWGVLHVGAGSWLLLILGAEGTQAVMAQFGLPSRVVLPEASLGVIGALAGQHAANLAILGVFGLVLGIWTMRTRSVFGLWLNVLVIGLVDIAFLTAFYLPGYVRGVSGLLGPALFALAALFTWLGLHTLKE